MCVNLLQSVQSSLLRAFRNLRGQRFYNLSQCIIILRGAGGGESHIQLEPPFFQVMAVVSHSPMKPAFVFVVTYVMLWKAAIGSVQSCLFSRLNKAVFLRLFIQVLCSSPMTILMAFGWFFVVVFKL